MTAREKKTLGAATRGIIQVWGLYLVYFHILATPAQVYAEQRTYNDEL